MEKHFQINDAFLRRYVLIDEFVKLCKRVTIIPQIYFL